MAKERNRKPAVQRGFTLIELAIATMVLIVGVVAVMQLVPAAMQSNLRNRYDTTATVLAQRQLDQMITQPLGSLQFTDADGRVIALGDPTKVNQVVGGPVQAVGSTARINFNAPAVASYNFVAVDPNDASGTPYEVRWAVITNTVGGTVVSKRFIVGAWRRDPRQTAPPVTVEGLVEK
jgi:type II secretory pathway pseudopilin PulG